MAVSSFGREAWYHLQSLSYTEIFVWVAVTLVGYSLTLAIYRVYFHPLAKYPGDLIDKITDARLIYRIIFGGDRHLGVYEAHQKYGPVVRTGPNTLAFDTVGALQAIHKDRNANVKKGEWYKTVDATSGDYSVQTVQDKREHAFRRRVLNPAFSESALREQEKFIDENARIFLQVVSKDVDEDGWSTAKDLNVWITYYGFDFISDLSFGSSFNLLEHEEHRYLPSLLEGTNRFLYYAGYLPFPPLVRAIMGSGMMDRLPNKAARDTQKFYTMAGDKLDERRKLDEEANANGKEVRRDIFHYIFRSRDPETGIGLSRQKLQADAGLLIAAGSDGVAVTVASTVFYLLQNPECMVKLVAEIRSSFDSFDNVMGPKLNKLTYLAAVLNEAMRLAPGVPSPFPREVCKGGIVVDGERIPEGSIIGVAPYAIHHNEAYFPDSFAFRPERWIADKEDSDNAKSVAEAKAAFFNFGAGPYSCIGMGVAILASKLVLAKMLYRYDVRAANGKLTGGGRKGLGRGREREDEYQLEDILVSYRNGPMIQLKEREG